MRDRADIRRRVHESGSIRAVARDLDAGRNTIRRALAADARDEYWRPSMSEEYEPAVRDVLADHPRLSVSQVGELIEWPGSRRQLSDLVARLRPAALDREVEDLNRPVLGTLRLGAITAGRLVIGRLTVGSTDATAQGQASAA